MGNLEMQDLSNEEADAIACRVQDRTYPLLDTESEEVSTAVAIQIGSRFFLATAGHVLANGQRLALVSATGQHPVPEIKRGYVHHPEEVDCGYLEFKAGDASSVRNFLDPNGILVRFDPASAMDVLICGWPIAGYRRVSATEERAISLLVWSRIVPLGQWPKNLERKPSPDSDVFVKYPKQSQSFATLRTVPGERFGDGERNVVSPHGLSGAGIWLVISNERPDSGIWHPSPQLIGLQTGFYEKSRLLHGNTMDCWLDLVAKDYPDLEAEIARIRSRRLGL